MHIHIHIRAHMTRWRNRFNRVLIRWRQRIKRCRWKCSSTKQVGCDNAKHLLEIAPNAVMLPCENGWLAGGMANQKNEMPYHRMMVIVLEQRQKTRATAWLIMFCISRISSSRPCSTTKFTFSYSVRILSFFLFRSLKFWAFFRDGLQLLVRQSKNASFQ